MRRCVMAVRGGAVPGQCFLESTKPNYVFYLSCLLTTDCVMLLFFSSF